MTSTLPHTPGCSDSTMCGTAGGENEVRPFCPSASVIKIEIFPSFFQLLSPASRLQLQRLCLPVRVHGLVLSQLPTHAISLVPMTDSSPPPSSTLTSRDQATNDTGLQNSALTKFRSRIMVPVLLSQCQTVTLGTSDVF